MAVTACSLPVVFLVVVVVSAAYVSTASGQAASSAQRTTVPEACAKTRFPKFCQEGLLGSKSITSSQTIYTPFAIVASYLNVMDTAASDDVAYLKGVIAGGKAPKCLDACLAGLEAAAARIRDGNANVMHPVNLEQFRAWASAAVRGNGVCADNPSCAEFFAKGGAEKDEFVQRIGGPMQKMLQIVLDLMAADAEATRAADAEAEKNPAAYGTLPSP